jgi:nucleoid-associated protein YejK
MAIIKAAVIHKLNKEQHGEATVQLRDEPLELTDEVQELVNNINNLLIPTRS